MPELTKKEVTKLIKLIKKQAKINNSDTILLAKLITFNDSVK